MQDVFPYLTKSFLWVANKFANESFIFCKMTKTMDSWIGLSRKEALIVEDKIFEIEARRIN